MCLELLEEQLRPGARALDVGSGSGFLAVAMALMTESQGKVHAIDVIEPLVEKSIENVRKSGHGNLLDEKVLSIRLGDGWKGVPGEQFDVIHVGAAADTLPEALVAQLAPGGRLVIPVGPDGGEQHLQLIERRADNTLSERTLTGVRYVPLVKQ